MTKKACVTCGGTGRLYAMRSWFKADGYSSLKCGYCGGSGRSSYRTAAHYIKFQQQARTEVRGASVKAEAHS